MDELIDLSPKELARKKYGQAKICEVCKREKKELWVCSTRQKVHCSVCRLKLCLCDNCIHQKIKEIMMGV